MTLRFFYTSSFLSFVASHMLNYAAIMYGLELFNSPLLAGVAYGLCYGPTVIFGWLAGAYIDRYSGKKILLISQNSYVIGAALFLWVMVGKPEYAVQLFLIACFFIGLGWSFVAPSRLSMLGQFVAEKDLAKTMIIYGLLMSVGFGFAPMILTQIVDIFDWPAAISLCIAMYVISYLMTINAPNYHERISHQNLWQEWKTLFSELKENDILRQLLYIIAVSFLMMGPVQVILPQIADSTLGLSTVEKGRYLGLIAFALIAGNVLALRIKSHFSVGNSIFAMLVISGVSLSLIGVFQSVWSSCFALICATMLVGSLISLSLASLQHYSPAILRGRVMSMYSILSLGVSALSGVLAGALSEAFSPNITLYIMGGLIISLALFLFTVSPAIRQFKRFE